MKKLLFAFLIAAVFQTGVFAQTDDFRKGLALAKANDFQNALASFQKSFDAKLSREKLARIHYNIGVCHYRLNQADKAVTEFDKAISLAPDYAKAFYAKAMALIDLRDFEQAEKSFLQAARLDETNGEIWFDLGLLFYESQKFNQAANAFQYAIKFKSVAKSTSYNNLGVCFALQGDFQSAKKVIEIAAKANIPEATKNLEILRQISNENNKNLTAKLIIKEKF